MKDFNNKIKINQFSEKFLIKNLKYFSSKVCLENQINLTPYFCFRYLYNNITEPLHNRVYYNNIIEYFRKKRELHDNLIDIYVNIFDICMKERINNKYTSNEIKIQNINENDTIKPLFKCNGKCNDCIDKYCDY